MVDRDVALAVLDAPIDDENSGARTLRGYFVALARSAWLDDNFSGKRPFGYSSWHFDVYAALIRAGLVDGRLDNDGFVDQIEAGQRQLADDLIMAALNELAQVGHGS